MPRLSTSAGPYIRGDLLGSALWLVLVAGVSTAQALPVDTFVTVQPIQVRADDGAADFTVGLFEAETDKIWRQAGIDIEFLPFVTLDESDFLVLEDTSEIVGLFIGAGHGQHPDPLVLNMWFVNEILPPARTFGIAFVGGNGI